MSVTRIAGAAVVAATAWGFVGTHLGAADDLGAGPAGQATPYRLLEGSTLTVECIPCGAPPITFPIRGGFLLEARESDPLFTRYGVADFELSSTGTWDYRGRGAGTYARGGEVALLEEMDLEVAINENEPVRLQSGLVPPQARFPWIEIDLEQTPMPEWGWFFHMHLVAAPWPQLLFSTEVGFHPSDPAALGAASASDGDLLSSAGRIVRTNNELTARLGIMPVVPDIGLDAVLAAGNTSGALARELWFSAEEDIFSETLGPLSQGDLLSDAGRVVRRNAELIREFVPMPPVPPLGLDAVQQGPEGLLLFSTEEGFFSERLGRQIDHGDLLREDGSVVKTHEELLAGFAPAVAPGSFGLDAVYVWPHGEVWFSVEEDFEDRRLGHVGHGDLLSDTGRVVARNLELLAPFAPVERLADFGLDALALDSAPHFAGCGTLVQGVECVLFQADTGGLYVLDDLGGFGAGSRVRVSGVLDPACATICMQGDGCIRHNTIEPCEPVPALRCLASGREVLLEWVDPPIDALIDAFRIARDGKTVATVPPEQHSYTDTVPGPGTYSYAVYAVLRGGGEFLVGTCRVTVTGAVPPPQDLSCTLVDDQPIDPAPQADDPRAVDADGDGTVDPLPLAAVLLEWSNPVRYERIVVARNRAIIATLPGDATRFVDRVPGGGLFLYQVWGVVGSQSSESAECTVEVPPPIVPPPQDFRCVLLEVVLDPADPDNPATPGLGDSRNPPLPVVLLSWWNPVRYSSLVVLRDGAVLARLPGDAMLYRDVRPPAGRHVYGLFGLVLDGRQSPTVECEITVGEPVPPVVDLACRVEEPEPDAAGRSVLLTWENAAPYEAIAVTRDRESIFEGPGDTRRYRDSGLEPGIYVYCVIAFRGGASSAPSCCQVVIGGPARRNLLYFTPRAAEPGEAPPEPPPVPPLPGSRITCRADTIDPVQGWSFGVGSDPKFIVPVSFDLEGTATQTFHGGRGPDFLHVDILADGSGLVMAVVIDVEAIEPPETLPAGLGHRLLNIDYAAGPSGRPGDSYPVRYTGTLGDPPVQVLFVVRGFEVIPFTLPGWVSLPGPRFLRGDANSDGTVQMSDAMYTLLWLFRGGRKPGCLEAANANGSTQVNLADPVYTLNYLYIGGPPPPWPFPFCGLAPAPLGCEEPGPCPEPPEG